ncbi:MAG: hypothetical protein CMI67_24515, partial [Pelagibaca sp.]|nr:hypothetical protein [Pelagibaca sp.]
YPSRKPWDKSVRGKGNLGHHPICATEPVYASNKEQEQAIEAFISVINSYWAHDYDEKEFVFDKLSVSTRVENRFTGNSLPLNALSSGENKIVSIFARLYLSDESKFIVLIDEPEL